MLLESDKIKADEIGKMFEKSSKIDNDASTECYQAALIMAEYKNEQRKVFVLPNCELRICEDKQSNCDIFYVISDCELRICEDNYEKGEIGGESVVRPDCSYMKQAKTLRELIDEFLQEECNGHQFDKEEWSYDEETPNRLELSTLGRLVTDYAIFEDPTEEELEKFKQGEINLSTFVYDLKIEKRIIMSDINEEFKSLEISQM